MLPQDKKQGPSSIEKLWAGLLSISSVVFLLLIAFLDLMYNWVSPYWKPEEKNKK